MDDRTFDAWWYGEGQNYTTTEARCRAAWQEAVKRMDEPNMNDRAEEALAERKLLGVTNEEWSHAMGLACEMAANGSKLGAAILIIKAIREAVKLEREACARLVETTPLMAYCTESSRNMLAGNRVEAAAAIRSRSGVLTPREVQG